MLYLPEPWLTAPTRGRARAFQPGAAFQEEAAPRA